MVLCVMQVLYLKSWLEFCCLGNSFYLGRYGAMMSANVQRKYICHDARQIGSDTKQGDNQTLKKLGFTLEFQKRL